MEGRTCRNTSATHLNLYVHEAPVDIDLVGEGSPELEENAVLDLRSVEAVSWVQFSVA